MKTFEEDFKNRLDSIIQRSEAVGLSVTELCRRTRIARATPDRWRKEAPLSIKLIDKLEAEVVVAEKAAAANR